MVATATGWTLDEIQELPFRVVQELLEYWQEYPPPHILLRAGVRIKSRRKKGKSDPDSEYARTQVVGAVAPRASVYVDSNIPDFVREQIRKDDEAAKAKAEAKKGKK
jgi:hypothetical protein